MTDERLITKPPRNDVSEKLVSMREQITVVIPTLNEEEAIGPLIDEVKVAGYSKIIVVDGYSKDRTVEIAREKGTLVIGQHGRGKAGALSTTFHLLETPYVAVIDGDGSYNPADIDRFLRVLGKYDFVKGERIAKGVMSRLHRLGNYIITRSFNLLFGSSIPDVCSGIYAMRAKILKELNFEKHPLSVEQEILAQLLASGKIITSVPVSYRNRYGGRSKVNTWRQGFRDLITNIDLALAYNPIMLFSVVASLILIPAFGLLFYASYLYLFYHSYHGGYFLASLILFVLGAQGFTVATVAAMLRRIERKLNSISQEG